MGLAQSAALVTIKDGQGITYTMANGQTIAVSPSGILSFSLQSTQGVATWTLAIQSPNFPGLNGSVLTWNNGQANLLQVQLPLGDSFVGSFVATVSDGQASVQYSTGTIVTKGAFSVPVQHVARLATQAALAAYTNVSGVLTANANGALATIDSVAPAVGDLVLLTMGAAAADNGLYQVTSLGGASAPSVFTRAADWGNGSLLFPGTTVEVSEGALYGPSTWKVTTAGTSTVGTTAVAIYPRMSIATTGAGSAGSATTGTTMFNLTAGTGTSFCAVSTKTVGGTQVGAPLVTITPGVPGVGKVVLTIGGSDTSTYFVCVLNW
jgi:hypothetical protein